MPIFLKVFNLIAAAVFAVFSALQWNDLDPAIYDNPSIVDAATWGIFYGFVAILFAVVLIRRLSRWMLILAVVFCLIELGRTAPGLWENITGDAAFNITQDGMSADDPRIELSREFFGALIALVGIGIIAFENTRWGRSRGKRSDPGQRIKGSDPDL
jgi:hypothetical protein